MTDTDTRVVIRSGYQPGIVVTIAAAETVALDEVLTHVDLIRRVVTPPQEEATPVEVSVGSQPIRTGDRVRMRGHASVGVVARVAAGRAAVRWTPGGGPVWEPAENLERVPDEPIPDDVEHWEIPGLHDADGDPQHD